MIGCTLPANWTFKRLKYLATYNDEVCFLRVPTTKQRSTTLKYLVSLCLAESRK